MTNTAFGSDTDYYTWRQTDVRTRRGTFALYSKPGMARFGQPDHAATLLADEMEVEAGDHLILLNSGAGLPGLATAADGAHVLMADANVVSAEAARRTAEANGFADLVTVTTRDGTPALPGDLAADVAAVLLPKGKIVALQCIWDAYQALKPGGRFYIAGANAEGAKSAFRYAEDLFGTVAVRGYRKGCRVGVAAKPATPLPATTRFQEPWLDHGYDFRFDVDIGDSTLKVCSRPGVFSWDRLDVGTQTLLSAMEIDPLDHLLDLGCGNGIVGAAAAMMAPQGEVLMVDADINAVVSARRTLAANGITAAAAELSDCAAVVQDRTFDVVVTNPPFHQGKGTQYDIAHQFIRDAARLLRPQGRFYLVANRFIPYEDVIRHWLGQVDTIFEDRRFKVLLGLKT